MVSDAAATKAPIAKIADKKMYKDKAEYYSKNGLKKLLKLRILKINGVNIKDLYLNNLINPPIINKEANNLKINANKIIFPTDTKQINI